MLVTAHLIVVLFAIAIILLSLCGIAVPERLMLVLRKVMDASWGVAFAIIVRVVLGVSLLLIAPLSKYPTLFEALGLLTLLAAAVLAVIGRKRLLRLIDWLTRISGSIVRWWFLVGVLVGVFLLYGTSSNWS